MPKTMIAQRSIWTKVAFGDVVQLSRERSSDPERDGHERFVGLEHIDPGDLRLRRWGNVADGVTFTSVFRPGQVLFGKRRAYQRKVAVADFSGVCSGDIYVIEPKGKALLPELLPFICQTEAFFEHAVGTSAGSLSPRTNWESLASFEFTLPSIEEQRRVVVVARQLDITRNVLSVARERLAALRKSRLESLYSLEANGNWEFVTLTQLATTGELEYQTGPFGTVLSASEYTSNGWPIVNPTNIRDGKIVAGNGPRVANETAERMSRYRLRNRDVLLARKGEIDKACIALSAHEGWITGSDCIRLRVSSSRLTPEYLLCCLQAPYTARDLRSKAHGTVMPGLNEKMLGSVVVPLSSVATQEVFVQQVVQLNTAEDLLDMRIANVDVLRHMALSFVAGTTSQ